MDFLLESSGVARALEAPVTLNEVLGSYCETPEKFSYVVSLLERLPGFAKEKLTLSNHIVHGKLPYDSLIGLTMDDLSELQKVMDYLDFPENLIQKLKLLTDTAFLEGFFPIWSGDFVIYKDEQYRVVKTSPEHIVLVNSLKREEVTAPFPEVEICMASFDVIPELFSEYGEIFAMTRGKFQLCFPDGSLLTEGMLISTPEYPLLRLLFIYPGNYHKPGSLFTRDILTGKGVKIYDFNHVTAVDRSKF